MPSASSLRERRACAREGGVPRPHEILIEARANASWSLDFVHDQFACGRRFRVLTVVDTFSGNVPVLDFGGRVKDRWAPVAAG